MQIFHCSPDLIQTFDYTNGVHFGGLHSALEAGNRKLNNINLKYSENQDHLYLYTAELTCNSFYDSFDVGGYEDWLRVIKQAKEDGYEVIRYVNKYEPDTVPSYIVLSSSLINQVSFKKIKGNLC